MGRHRRRAWARTVCRRVRGTVSRRGRRASSRNGAGSCYARSGLGQRIGGIGMASDREARIRTRAYELWERDGRPHGRDKEHWARAAREIEDDAGRGANMSIGPRPAPASDPARGASTAVGGPSAGPAPAPGSTPAGGAGGIAAPAPSSRPTAVGGVSSGPQPGGARPSGGAPAGTERSLGTGGGAAGQPPGSPSERNR